MAAISATVVLTVGALPFLGLIVPNIVTVYRGDNVRTNLAHTALLGAAFVVGCDIVGRLIISPYEVSVGLIMGVIGSVLFLVMLAAAKRTRRTRKVSADDGRHGQRRAQETAGALR